ncbi:vang-like protein 2-B isoform X1 [Phymastichus coffea]|uniref:vang-like protein 2-B isoform X1 n=1 Tax=Phymastichus coffea TaxID=108790 RepID=UPI00273B4063|nr:vang-like protein 2-B isoform X1 [Phymastichus coffea]XP_058810419.1 vang-like protein 2-B isoform X1 [Phymastichus coffea]XP_058810420.1 vang-like protein 2-B isoform X1 [Phymastichus coffea]XP_058810421.1 vang-like protein 2-B isoform X1 [Phymastichus coffea]
MAPFQTIVTNREENEDGEHSMIDLQILSDHENWAENTTAITGNTSERSESLQGIDQWPQDGKFSKVSWLHYFTKSLSLIIFVAACTSPFIMVVLPKLGLLSDNTAIYTVQQKLMHTSCNVECKGCLLSIAFKIPLLGIGYWIVFYKSREDVTPRLSLFRNGVIFFTFLCLSAYWLFYIVQITELSKTVTLGNLTDYKSLVNYAVMFIDTLLAIHYIAVLLMEIRHLKAIYYVKVVRSPDGISHSFSMGQLTVQQAAVQILEKYYTEFPIYNPYLERIPLSKTQKKAQPNNFKFYRVDDTNNVNSEEYRPPGIEGNQAILAAQARRRDSSHNERFYEEHEYERRVRKRKARLITAVEEAFSHVQRIHTESVSGLTTNSLDSLEAAQSIFPSMARALQKYLRITRQQPQHAVENILKRLAQCLSQDTSPKVFLEPYFNPKPVLSDEKEKLLNIQQWALICDGELPSRPLRSGCEFQLRQGEIALLCSFYQLPCFHLSEQIALPKYDKFLLKLNSEICP